MITEDYVSFETAKLLKEKGFDWECLGTYSTGDKELSISSECPYSNDLNDDMFIATPTLQMAMKWLREVHNLVIQIEFIDYLEHGEVWLYSVLERRTIKRLTGRDEDFTEHSYEEACEAAIKYCLENLI